MVDSLEIAIEKPEDAFFAIETRVYSTPLSALELVEYGANTDLPAGTVFHGIIKDSSPITAALTASVTEHKGAAGARVYRRTVDTADATFTVAIVEYNDANYSLYTGKTKNATTGAYHIDPSTLGELRMFWFEHDDSTGKRIRQWAPRGQVTERGDRTFISTEATGFDLTIGTFSTMVAGERANILEWHEDITTTPVVPEGE